MTCDSKMSSVCKQGKTVHSEVREVMAGVVKLCDEKDRSKELTFPLTLATDTAAKYIGVSGPL
jgi:hypothetical protein